MVTKWQVDGEVVGWRRSSSKTHILEIRIEGLTKADIKELEQSTQTPLAHVGIATYEPEREESET